MGEFLKWIGRFFAGPVGFIGDEIKGLSNLIFGTDFDNRFSDFVHIAKGDYVPSIASSEIANSNTSNLNGVVGNFLNSLAGKYAETGLTGKDVAMNEYTAEREDTRYQRAVADMQAAGLNPALMYQNGGSAPSVNSSAGSAGGSISDLLQIAMLPAQLRSIKADIDVKQAEAGKIKADTDFTVQAKEFAARMQPLLEEARKVGNELSRTQVRKVEKDIDLIVEEIGKVAAEAKTEETRQALFIEQSILARAEAEQLVALMPYRQELLQAQSAEARAHASLMAIQEMYQQRILDSDYLDNMFDVMRSQAQSAESQAALDDLRSRIRTGKLIQTAEDASLLAKIGAGVINYPVAVVANTLDSASSVIAAAIGGSAAVKVAGLKGAPSQSQVIRTLSSGELDRYNSLLGGSR